MSSRGRRLASLLVLLLGAAACSAGSPAGGAGGGGAAGASSTVSDAPGEVRTGGPSHRTLPALTAKPRAPRIPRLPTCTGADPLCSRPYDRVVFAATHNAHTVGVKLPGYTNQNKGVSEQLAAGIRGLMLDVGRKRLTGAIHVCHGGCDPAGPSTIADWGPFRAQLSLIDEFLRGHEADVVTVILEFTDGVTPDDLVAELRAAGVERRVFTKAPEQPWPTLGELGGRLIVFASRWEPYGCLSPAASELMMRYWDNAFENPYSYEHVADFATPRACSVDRGTSGGLFVLNHFLTSGDILLTWNPLGLTPLQDTNGPSLPQHVEACRAARGRWPNFIAVDWYDEGGYGGFGSLAGFVADLNARGGGGPAAGVDCVTATP